MKRYEFNIEPLPPSPLIGLYINQCEMQFEDKKWHPTLKIELGFLFFKINFTYVKYNS
jgi:hypothetical protein